MKRDDSKMKPCKNYASGKYAACMAKAERILVLTGDVAVHDAIDGLCERRFAANWNKLELAASAAGTPCPSRGDELAVQTFLEGCGQSIAEAADGGTLRPDPIACTRDLNACNSTLNACTLGLPPASPLKTGQTSSYGAGTDGDVQAGVARWFTDNGDGTVTDNATGLMWEKKSDDGSIHDWDGAYSWGYGITSMDTLATEFLAPLNTPPCFADHCDWRIPNLFELTTLANLEVTNPATYPAFNTACTPGCTVDGAGGTTQCSCTQPFGYWSSSTCQGDALWGGVWYAWFVSFDVGNTTWDLKDHGRYVRAVRGGL